MRKILPFRAVLMGAALACVAGAPAIAQETSPAAVATQDGAVVDPAAAAAADVPCKPKKKKKKGFGLGGLLKAAQSSGLTNMAGMGGLGKGGALASAALGTAASLSSSAASSDAARQEEPAVGGC